MSSSSSSSSHYTILVTAATGIVSGYVLQHLERLVTPATRIDGKPVKIIASARSQAKAEQLAAAALKPGGRKTVVLDFDDPRGFANAFQGIDAVFLSTGYTANMMDQSKLLIDASKKAGVKHIVHLGADDTGASSTVGHICWHLLIEAYLKTEFTSQGRTFTLLHPAMFNQNLHTYNGRPWYNPQTCLVSFPIPPYGLIAWIDCYDIAEVGARSLLNPLKHGGQIYKLAGEYLAIDQVCEILSKTLGKQIGFELVSADRLMREAVEDTPNDYGRLAYISCVAKMTKTSQDALERVSKSTNTKNGEMARGKPPKVWPEVIEQVCGRKFTGMAEFARRECGKFGVERGLLPGSADKVRL